METHVDQAKAQESTRLNREPSTKAEASGAGELQVILALQRTAGNQAVADLLQRAPAAAHPATAPKAAAEPLYHLTIGSDDRNGITKPEAVKMLRRHYMRIKGATEAEKDGLADLRKIHEDQWIVGAISDYAGGGGLFGKLHMPEDSVFDPAFAALAEANAALDAGTLEKSADKLMDADFKYQDAREKVTAYREGTISGSGRSITALKVTVAVGAVAATVATGGTATAAGAGLLGTAGAVAVGAGTYSEFSEMGTQGGEMIAGTRQAGMFDPAAIIKKAAVDAALAFVTAYLGGKLTKYLVETFGTYLMSSMSEEALAAFREEIGVAVGPLHPEAFVSASQKWVIEFFSGVALTPLTTSVTTVIKRIQGEKFPGPKAFTKQVLTDMVENGLMTLFFAAVTHGAKSAGMETGMEPPGSTGTDSKGGAGSERDVAPLPDRSQAPAAPKSELGYGEIALDESGPSLELDTDAKPLAPDQQPQMGYGERNLQPEPGAKDLTTYRGNRPMLDVVPRARRPAFGTPSTEPAGTESRKGMSFHEYNAAEIGPMRLRVDFDPVAGVPRRITYQVQAGDHPAAVTDRGFTQDASVEGAQSRDAAYRNSGMERGHMGQREAAAGDAEAEAATDQMTNITPMTEALNRGAGSPWRAAEARAFTLANEMQQAGRGDYVTVDVVPIYDENPTRLTDGTPIPKAFTRTVTAPDGKELESVSYLNQ